MKNLFRLSLLLLTISFFSCKKAIENKQRDLLVEAITNGDWVVKQYFEGLTDITYQFNGYSFQFEEAGAVHANYFGIFDHGTWTGDMNTYSITSQFGGVGDPLKKLNGTWKLTDSYWDYVKAEMITATGKNFLHLIKKP